MSKVAKVAVSLLLTVCGNSKTQSHIRLIREKAPLLPHAAAWPAFASASITKIITVKGT